MPNINITEYINNRYSNKKYLTISDVENRIISYFPTLTSYGENVSILDDMLRVENRYDDIFVFKNKTNSKNTIKTYNIKIDEIDEKIDGILRYFFNINKNIIPFIYNKKLVVLTNQYKSQSQSDGIYLNDISFTFKDYRFSYINSYISVIDISSPNWIVDINDISNDTYLFIFSNKDKIIPLIPVYIAIDRSTKKIYPLQNIIYLDMNNLNKYDFYFGYISKSFINCSDLVFKFNDNNIKQKFFDYLNSIIYINTTKNDYNQVIKPEIEKPRKIFKNNFNIDLQNNNNFSIINNLKTNLVCGEFFVYIDSVINFNNNIHQLIKNINKLNFRFYNKIYGYFIEV